MLDELRQLTPKKLVARHGGYRGKEGEFIPGLKPQPKKPAKGTSGKSYINRVRFIIFTEIPAIRIVRGSGVVQTGVLYREPLIRILDDNFSEAELNKSITKYAKYLKDNESQIVKYCHIIAYASSVEDMQSAFTECAYLINQNFLSVEQAEEFDELYNETMWGEL